MTYAIDHSARRVTLTGSGVPSPDAMLACLRALAADPDFSADYDRVWDMRGLTAPLDRDGLTSLVRGYRGIGLAGRRVAFVLEEDAYFGMARMFASMAEPSGEVEFGVFRRMEDAERWVHDGGAA